RRPASPLFPYTALFRSSLLADYVRSPSLRHMREQRSLAKLALEIVTKLDQDSSVWRKWEGPRDKVLASAIDCWIPKDDMLAFLRSEEHTSELQSRENLV